MYTSSDSGNTPNLSPLPWQLEVTESGGKVIRAQVVDARGVAIITVKSPSPQAMENTRRLTAAANATASFSTPQLEAQTINRSVAALHTVVRAADPTGSIQLKPKTHRALSRLASELPPASYIR